MTRLARKNIKVFAENAANNGVFGSLQAGNPVTTTNVEQVQSLPAWSTGWNSATMTSEKLPPLEEFQGIQYVTTYQQAYLMQEGVPEWATTVTYYKGCLAKEVTSTGFRIYNSLTNDNTGNLLSDTSKWKKVMDSDDLYAFDSDVVHIAGTETITGTKTFTQNVTVSKSSGTNLILKMTDATQGTPPASGEYNGFLYFRDSSNNGLGAIKCAYQSSGVSYMNMYAWKHDGSGDNPAIGVYCDANNVGYATAPSTRTDRSASGDIITRDWIPKDMRIVHTTDNETIAGTKTFTSNVVINKSLSALDLKNPDLTKGTTPTTASPYCAVNFKDKDGKTLGDLLYFYNNSSGGAAKETGVALRAYKANAASDSDIASLTIAYPASGNPITQAPASDVANSIVTTVNKSKAANGYFQLGNGLIVQWGRITVNSVEGIVTLPKAFTSTNYTTLATYHDSTGLGSNRGHPCIKAQTTTTFTWGCDSATSYLYWIAIGY